MSDTDDIIDLQIAVSDKAPEVPNFGMPMLVDYHTAWSTDYVREYSQADDLLDDGFTTSSPLYLRATSLKSQSPAPPTFKVGRLATGYTQTVRLFPTVTTTGFVYNFSIAGTPITYTVLPAATVATICTALELLVEAVAGIASSATATYVEAVSDLGVFNAYVTERGLNLLDMTVDAGFSANMAFIVDEDDDWYGLIPPPLDTYVAAAATWTEARVKTCYPQLSGYDVLDSGTTTDTASDLVLQAYTRTAPIWHRAVGGDEYIGEAWAATILGRDPGAATPAFKTLAGIAADDLRSGDRTGLSNKFVTRYMRQGGANITFEGKTPSGRYIDVTRNVDFMEAQVRANIFAVFLNNAVVPYTDEGISLIKGAIGTALQTCAQLGIIVPGFTVTAPKVADTTTADRAQRILRNVEFTARLAGAIHRVVVRGTVSV